MLKPVSNATHVRSGSVARCDPGTRLEVIAAIEQWLNSPDKQAVCWLNGPAGYGKSALAQTIAERYDEKNRPIGSFFFLRGAGERSHISRLIPTLTHQISLSAPACKPLLEKALQDEPDLLGSSISLARRFQKLIINPISTTIGEPWLLVIDALDECDDKVQMAEFIDVLIDVSRRGQLSFRVLLTSRVEEHIRKKFHDPRAQSVFYCIDLRDFDPRPDIQGYLQREFASIYGQHHPIMRWTPLPWPTPPALSKLLDMAGSSFMFAVTLIQFIGTSTIPDEALQQVLSSGITGLDPLYKQVLLNASPTPVLDQILGTLMIIFENPSIIFLSSLLCLQPQKIVQELLAVQSVVKIPGDDDEPVMLYHTSLRDFLIDQSRSGIYFINPHMQHIHLAMDCLKCLAQDSSKDFFNSKDKNYACLEWSHHFLLGLQGYKEFLDEAIINSSVSLLEIFLTLQGKTWYNTMLTIRYGDLDEIIERLKAGKLLLQVSHSHCIPATHLNLYKINKSL